MFVENWHDLLKIDVYIDIYLNTSVYNGSSRIKKFKSNNLEEIGKNLIIILNNLETKSSRQIVYIHGIDGHIVREYINRRGCMSICEMFIQ